MKRHYVLKNKKRFMTVIGILAVLFLLFLNPLTSSGTKEQQFATVYISEGDTLWNIAEQFDPNGNVRKLIYDIKEANGLESYYIQAGTTIKIPI